MKKRMSKILSALLVSALVMSTGNVVQAEDAGETASGKMQVTGELLEENVGAKAKSQQAAEIQQEAESRALGAMSVPGAAKEITAKASSDVEQNIPLKKMKTGKEEPAIGDIAYINSGDYKKGKNYRYGYSQKVLLTTKGTLRMGVRGYYGTERIYFGLFKDAGLTNAVDSYSFVNVGSTSYYTFKVPKKGTYYMGIYSDIYSAEGTSVVGAYVTAAFYNGSDRTIKSGEQIAVGAKQAQTNYFKFKVKKTGYITVPYISNCVDKVTLCNSKKKAISTATSPSRAVYGVKKNTTYYIKVKSYYTSRGGYIFQFLNKEIKEKSGTKQSKAVTIKKKAKKKGTIQAGSGQADWYKFTLKKQSKVKITFDGETNDQMRMRILQGKKEIKIRNGNGTLQYEGPYLVSGTLKKGTYYIKIERGTKKSSGYYSITWK